MIKLKNEIFENEFFVEGIRKIYTNDQLSIGITYKFLKIYKILEEQNIFYYEVKDKIAKKYGDNREDNKFVIPRENVESYTNELQELLRMEFELDADKIMYDENMKLSAADISALSVLIDFSKLE